MSAWKLIYRVFRQVAILAALTGIAATTACSDGTSAANEKGALAQSQLEAGQIAEARQTIHDAIQERDDIAELHLLRGRIEMAANSPANAFAAYSSALALDSTNLEALVGVAQFGLQVGRFRDSEDAADRILTLDPTQKNGLIVKGWHNIVKRRLPEAIANAEAILSNTPDDEAAIILKARALALEGKFEDAFNVVQSIRKDSKDTADIATTMLELHRALDDGKAMVPMLERLRELSPDVVKLDVDEADTLYKLGDRQRARAILFKRLFDPKLDEAGAASIGRIWAEYDPRPLNAAQLGAVAAKANEPARNAMARLLLDNGDVTAASAVLSGPSTSNDILAMRAVVGIAQNRIPQSLTQADAILARDKNHCDALLARAQAKIALRQTDDAIAASTLATTSCPRLVPAYLALVHAHALERNEAGILVAYRDGFDRNNQDSRLARSYTAWLVQKGQGTRALGIARQLTDNAPALISGWKLYQELCSRVPGASCQSEANAGMAAARHRFGPDLISGEAPPIGLAGRLTR